jgi:uncharacterized protein YndB with AHSA1/START domain
LVYQVKRQIGDWQNCDVEMGNVRSIDGGLGMEIVKNKKIVIEWSEPVTTVEFAFEALTNTATYVVIKNYGFSLQGDELIDAIKDNTGGFTTLLDGLKAYLEHRIKLNLVADKYPDKLQA